MEFVVQAGIFPGLCRYIVDSGTAMREFPACPQDMQQPILQPVHRPEFICTANTEGSHTSYDRLQNRLIKEWLKYVDKCSEICRSFFAILPSFFD